MFRDTYGDDGGCAQVTAPPPPQAIGKIQTATGPVTVVDASGVVAQVKVGDPVYRHDTIETGADGAVGITFIDGTAFNLSNNARLALNEFVCDGTSNSALFSLSKGAFSFIAGKVAKTGGLRIDTPFARIRGAAQDGGIGILTLAALAFSTIREIQAASRSDAFLDDGTITYKDSPHGTFEITTKDGRVIVADDPGETIVVDPAGSVTRLPNSSSRMAELQGAQQAALATLSMGLGQQGAAPGGSSTQFDVPQQLLPINFSQLQNQGPAPLAVTITTQTNPGAIDVPTFKPLPVEIKPVLAADVSGAHAVIELLHTTGSNTFDTTPAGELTFTHFNFSTVSASLDSIIWSGGATLPSGPNFAVLASALTTSVSIDSTISTSGSIAPTFSAPDNIFDFLAAGETLTIVYNVTVFGNDAAGLTQPVTITITGTNDAPVLAADTSGPHTTTQAVQTSGTLTFTDVDLTDHHTVSTSMASTTWSGGATPPSGIDAVLAGALSATVADSTGSGSGSIAFTFGAAGALDFLAAGQTLTITYNVTVTDDSGVSSTQPVTITVLGANDAAVIGDPTVHDVTEDVNVNGNGNLTAIGTIPITDTDQNQASFQTSVTGAQGNLGSLTLQANGSYTYTVADSLVQFLGANDTKVDTFTVTALDGTSKQISFTIHGSNNAAVIGDPTVHDVTEDVNVNGNGNLTAIGTIPITDTDQNQASFQTSVTGAQGNLGSLTLQANGSYTYTVADSLVQFLGANDTKVDTFTVTALDGTSKQISFTIHGANDAAVIGDPTVHDVTQDVNVNGNGNLTAIGTISITDTDQNQASFQTSVTGAQGNLGSLTLQANGSYTYTVADSLVQFLGANDTKVDTFTVTALDGTSKQISFTIHGGNNAAVIGDPTVHDVTEDVNVNGNGNLTAIGTIPITDTDQNQASFQTSVTGAQGNLGSLTLQANGSYTYTVADSLVQFLGANDTKVDTFTVTAFDGTSKQISFTIHGANDAAVIGDPPVHDVTEDVNVNGNGNLTAIGTIPITDTDQNQASFQTTVTGAQGNLGSLTLQANGSYTYTVADSLVQFLGANDTKVDTFTVTALDGTSKQISFTIHGANDAAVIGDPTVHDVTQDVNVNGNGNLTAIGTISITDADQNQASFQTSVTGAQGNLGSLTLQANGSYTYTVADSLVQFLGANDTKVDTFTVTAFDGTSKQISFTIHGGNNAAVIGDPTVHDVTEDVNVNGNGNLTAIGTIPITDTDQNQASFQTSVTGAQGNLGSLTLQANGSYTYTVADSLVQFLGANDTKVDTFTVTALDGTSKQISFTIHGANDAAVIGDPTVHDVTQDVNVNGNGNLTAIGTISITDTDQNQASFQTSVTGAQGNLGSLTLQANGSYTYTVADSLVQFLGANDTKVDTFTVTAFDGTSKQISFTIHGGNNAAVIGDPTVHDVTEDVNVNGNGNLTAIGTIPITDTDQNQASFQTSVTGAQGNLGSLTLQANGSYTYTVADSLVQFLGANDTKVDTFTVTALDGTSKQISFTIHGANDAAVIGDPTVHDVTEDVNVNGNGNLTAIGTIPITDTDQNQASFQTSVTGAQGNLGSLTLQANGSYTYTVADSLVQFLGANDTKVDTFTVTALDGTTKQINFTIHGTDDAFVIAPSDVVDLKLEPNNTLTHPLIENDGTIVSGSNNPNFIIGDITGTGLIFLSNNTTLTIEGSVASTLKVQFEVGQGVPPVLVLTDPSEFHATIFGFQGRDQIDLEGMTIAQATAWVASITFVGFTGTFKFASDGHGGTLLSDPPASTTTTDASTTTTDASTTTTDVSTTTTDASTTTTDATVIPVVQAPTPTAPELVSSRRKVAAAADDEAMMVALSTAVAVALSAAASDANGGEISSLTTSGGDTAADISGTVSGSDSSTVNSGAAPEFNPIWHRMAGAVTDNERVEVVEGKLQIAAAASETGMSKADAEAKLQLDGSDAVNARVITDGANADAINLPGDHTTKTARHVSDDGRGGKTAHNAPVSEAGEDTSAQSTSADNHFSVSSSLTEIPSGNGDHAASAFKPSVGHDASVDPGINLASIPKDQLLQHPADNLIHIPAQHDHGADPAHPHVDGNQSPSFKFADDASANPGAVPSDAPTLTALTSDPSGAHGPATRAHATDDDTPVQSAPNNGQHWGADPEINVASIPQNHSLEHPADNSPHMQHDDNGSPAVTDGAHPGRGQGDKSEPASPKFADVGDAHSAHATDEDTSVQSAPANNGHHWGADPEINFASIPQNHSLEHPADNSPHMQHDDNGSPAVTDGAQPAHSPFDGNQPASFKFADDGSAHPGHATGKDTSVQSTPADNDHHAIADPETNLASIAKNDLPQHPADNSSQHDDNGSPAVTDGAHTAHSQVDGDQLDTFKFADDGSAHPGTVVPHDSPTLTALSSDSSGTHGPAAPALANTVNVPGTVLSDPASDKFIFGNNFGHDTVAGHKPDMTEIDQTVSTDIQHLLDTAHETNAVSTLDPNHATAPQDMTKVLPHHQGDFHFA